MAPPRRDGGASAAKAVALIVVLVVIGVAVLNRAAGGGRAAVATTTHRTTTTTTSRSAAPSTTTTTVVPPSQVKVQVLNGVLTGSLAGQWTAKLKTNPGYVTEAPLDATAKVQSSVIYILTPGYTAEADALAAAVGLPATAVNPTIPPPSTAPIPATARAAANLVLVVGPDLAGTA